MAHAAAYEIDSEKGGGGGSSGSGFTILAEDATAKTLTFSAENIGGTVSGLLRNTDNTNTASHAVFEVKAGATAGGNSKLRLTGGATWDIVNARPNANGLEFYKGSDLVARFDPTSAGVFDVYPGGNSVARKVSISYDLGEGMTSGPTLENRSSLAGAFLSLTAAASNATGGVGIAARDTVANLYKYGLTMQNAAGPPVVKVAQGTGVALSVFNATGAGQATFGAATADGGGTTQTMVQAMWDALRGWGFGT